MGGGGTIWMCVPVASMRPTGAWRHRRKLPRYDWKTLLGFLQTIEEYKKMLIWHNREPIRCYMCQHPCPCIGTDTRTLIKLCVIKWATGFFLVTDLYLNKYIFLGDCYIFKQIKIKGSDTNSSDVTVFRLCVLYCDYFSVWPGMGEGPSPWVTQTLVMLLLGCSACQTNALLP